MTTTICNNVLAPLPPRLLRGGRWLPCAILAAGLSALSGWASAAELIVADGVVVKFGQNTQLVVRDKLTSGKNVVFTSQQDDSIAGQTNLVPQIPATAAWRGLRIEKSASSYGFTLIDNIIRYAGAQDSAGLTVRGFNPVLQYIQLTDNSIGLRVLQGAKPSVTGSSFLRNGTGVEADGNAQPAISASQFVQNTAQAILNKTPASVITATGNWWGHSSGPRDNVGNPQGRGDAVSTGVNYGQFLTLQPLINPAVRLTNPAPYFESSTLSLDIACVNAIEYRIAEGSAFVGVPFVHLSNERATVSYTVASGDGSKALSVQFRNAGGNIVTATLAGGVLIDTQVPALSITNPAAGSILSAPITIEASATDASGIARVEFYLNGQLQRTDTATPYNFSWNTDTSVDGDYVIRVVAYDLAGRSSEAIRSVSLLRLPPPPDVEGPTLVNLRIGSTALLDGASLVRSVTLSVDASDRSGIARIELLLDGIVVATASGSSTYNVNLNLNNIANGAHVLSLRATDSLNNVSSVTRNFTLTHAVPPAPLITQPVNNLNTRNETITISGTAQPASQVQLYLNGSAAGVPFVATGNGSFSGSVTLISGSNAIQATASDQYGSSPFSATVTAILDLSVPVSPSNLLATAQAGGKIRLTWTRSSDPNATGYYIYRATTAFSSTAEAGKLNNTPLTVTVYDDVPTDGSYYYRVVAVNGVGTPSAPTNQAQAVADATLPKALSVVYTPLGKVDPVSGRIGQGRVEMLLTVSEALQAAPYFAIVPQGGQPVTVDLIKNSDTQYSGAWVINASIPSGTANALFSARDVIGNRGTEISAGATLQIDTAGPQLTGITLNPGTPINNDTAPLIQAIFSFSKTPAVTPQVKYLLSNVGRSPVVLSGLTQTNPNTYQASFSLPGDAGLGSPETLSFSFQAQDDLDNISTQITAFNRFQVYQGELPPLPMPLGLTAKAQPGGKVALAWLAVTDITGTSASAYQIYRQAPGESVLTVYQRTAGISYIDQTAQDGIYLYAIATIRQSNGQESLSVQSAPVTVTASATAPGAPQNLQLALTGQGIWATWQASTGNVTSYNLYRSSGLTITSVQGMTPLISGIKTQAAAMDAYPSPTDHAYVVTAQDAAGNQSPISNSAYLNAGLLPVATLRVDQIDNNLPLLTWSASRSNVAGYHVYIGSANSKVKLTPAPISLLNFTDNGYTPGERRYTVAAVDANNVEMPRAILLPALSSRIDSGLPLKRGVMNRMQIQVINASDTAVGNIKVLVRVANKDHRSETFSLNANETKLIPVVVGGYADLPGQALAEVGVEIVPNEGEFIKISRSSTLDVIDSTLVVGITPAEFVRGAAGKVRLSVQNTSEVEVELLTALSNGSADSSELRFKILDADGNVLATQPYRQAFGANVITLTNSQTVARIAAGTSYTSDLFSLNVPGASPNSIRVKLEIDKLRYHTGQPDEVSIAGRGSEVTVSLIDTAYVGEVTNVTPVSSYGDQDVIITGRALDRATQAALPNTRLKLIFNQQGFERSFSVLTDTSGNFTYTFKPTTTDAGLYKVSAIHPDLTDRPEQKAFTINRVTVGPTPFKLDVPKNYRYNIPFIAKAGAGTVATNLRLALEAATQPTGQIPLGVSVTLPLPVNLTERQTANMPVVFTASNEAQPSGALIFNIYSDAHVNTPLGQLRVDYTLSEARPYLTSTPSLVETGLVQGGNQIETVVLENKGLQDALDVRLTLTNVDGSPAPAWVSIANGSNLGTLAIGAKVNIDLTFTPSAATAEGVYQFKLVLNGANVPQQSLNVYASVTQSGIGNVLFKVADIYTATVDKSGRLIPGLAGATITLQNEDVLTVTQTLTTDALGEAYFQTLPAGYYKFRAKATNHQEIGGRLIIKPGITLNQPVFLDYNLVTVEWSVREITIQDRYEITLNATYETNVPAAVVVMQPSSINLPLMSPGAVYYGELALTNFGLIRADNVRQKLPVSDGFFRFEFLVEVPPTLEAKQRVVIPYRVVSLQSLDGSGAASGGGCYNYSSSTSISCSYKCANGSTSTCGSSTSWFAVSNSTCGGGGGGGVGGGGGGGLGGGGFGGSGIGTSLPLTGQKCVFVPKGGGAQCN